MRIRNNEYAIPSKITRPAAKLIQKFLSERPQDRPQLETVLNDEFFTRGFFPRTLPSICCVAPPKFTSLRNRNISSSGRTRRIHKQDVKEQVNTVVKDALSKITIRDKTDGIEDDRHHESGFDSQESYPTTNGEERITDEEGELYCALLWESRFFLKSHWNLKVFPTINARLASTKNARLVNLHTPVVKYEILYQISQNRKSFFHGNHVPFDVHSVIYSFIQTVSPWSCKKLNRLESTS